MAMDRLTFSPSANEFFLWRTSQGEDDGHERADSAAARLRRVGWPTAARILRAGQRSLQEEGVLVELIDALPILAGAGIDPSSGGWHADKSSLLGWARVCRAGLEEIARGRLVPRVRGVELGGGDGRIGHIEAGWVMSLTLPRERKGLSRLAQEVGPWEVALPSGRLSSAQQMMPGHTSLDLAIKLLNACADTLIREASWRGAVVRLRDMPACSWEQQLVHALSDMHPALALRPDEAEALLAEINAWSDDEAEEPPLLPSPPSWQASESLKEVLRRMLAPAAELARHLLMMHPAPRTLSGRLADHAQDDTAVSAEPRLPGSHAPCGEGGE